MMPSEKESNQCPIEINALLNAGEISRVIVNK